MNNLEADTGEVEDTRLPVEAETEVSTTMQVLIEALATVRIDPNDLEIGELTGIHDLLLPLLGLCVSGSDREAVFMLLDGLNEAKERGFNYYSVQAVFPH